MPISFCPSHRLANSYKPTSSNSTPLDLLRSACPEQFKTSDEILQCSFTNEDLTGPEPIIARSNGLVNTICTAYNRHYALSLRPDDIWLCILTQFNFYVNANAEVLQSTFVSHEGQRELIVREDGNRYTVDFGKLAHQMTGELRKNVKDPSLTEWIIPKFTTTTNNDIVVSSVLMMSTMKKYFSYTFHLRCGIPRVTLEGEKSDWEELLRRIERLKKYGEQPTWWYNLLHPVLSRFVEAFDDPNGKDNIDFWKRVAHIYGGSGPRYLSGWVTAFCVWDADGRWMAYEPGQERPQMSSRIQNSNLELDGVKYHVLATSDIPAAYAAVDVKLDDNREIFETVMVAGLVGTRVYSSNDTKLSESGLLDVMKPVAGWWMFTKRHPSLPTRAEEDKRRLR